MCKNHYCLDITNRCQLLCKWLPFSFFFDVDYLHCWASTWHFLRIFCTILYNNNIFIDLSKAFDTINHNYLLEKMEHYGFRGTVHAWLKSYLENRQQYVQINCLNLNQSPADCLRAPSLAPNCLFFLLMTFVMFLIS